MHDLSHPDPAQRPTTGAEAGPVARYVVVTGRVQGVFFRASTEERASALGLVGWVRNREDGAVEAWVEGPAAAVDRLLAWARAGGPPAAVVDELAVEERTPAGHDRFEVR